MHDIWNPWHGCFKKSEGCQNCYMMFLDKIHGNPKQGIYKTSSFSYPLSTNRDGSYKVKTGELIRVCMNSDFFIEEADIWREEAWEIIRKRSDVIFFLLTKRPERILDCLPKDWGQGYENVFLNVTCENQLRAEERIPLLFQIPAKHKGIMCAPLLGEVHIEPYLEEGILEQIIVGGENYEGHRICDYAWVKALYEQAKRYNVKMAFIETGSSFLKDGKLYSIPSKIIQSKMAFRSGLSHPGKPIEFILKDPLGLDIPKSELYVKQYTSINCAECGSHLICDGCHNCGKCPQIQAKK